MIDERGAPFTIKDSTFIKSFVDCLSSHFARSLLWSFARSIPEPPDYDMSHEITVETFMKEFQASQRCFSQQAIFDYSIFRTGLSISARVANRHLRVLGQTVVRRLHTRIARMKPIYAQVQRVKNVSRETEFLYRAKYPTHIGDVRTLDLERHYMNTGEKIGGICEMRKAWKLADLKPRLYYCTGGHQYFFSRYMKLFAIEMMNSIPPTHVERRKEMTYQLHPDHNTDYVVAWDFSNFTTSLSDLKHFLHAISESLRSLDEDLRVTVVDSYLGFINVHPSDLLDDYNKHCNDHAPFSISRILSVLKDNEVNIDDEEYHQQNSGMLGVHGNIGFSTSNHGFVTCMECGKDRCVCVGDDALGITEYPEDLVNHMQRLGNIVPEKFSIIDPGSDHVIKFLKRALYRSEDNTLDFDFLYNLPNPMYIDERYGNRTFQKPDEEGRAYRIATSLGKLLWDINQSRMDRQMDDQDYLLLRTYLNPIYMAFQFPMHGSLPGYFYPKFNKRINYAIPPLIDIREGPEYFDPRRSDWLEFLFDNIFQDIYRVPIFCVLFDFERPNRGDIVYWPKTRFLIFLEDMEIAKATSLYEDVRFLSKFNQRCLRMHFGKFKTVGVVELMQVEVLCDIPDRFDAIFKVPSGTGSNVMLKDYV
jgi:hypothetical protein